MIFADMQLNYDAISENAISSFQEKMFIFSERVANFGDLAIFVIFLKKNAQKR